MRYLLVLALLLAGCSTQLTKEGEKVRVIDSKSGLNYEYLGPLTARQTFGSSDSVLSAARNKAAKKGANAVYVQSMIDINSETSVTVDCLRITD